MLQSRILLHDRAKATLARRCWCLRYCACYFRAFQQQNSCMPLPRMAHWQTVRSQGEEVWRLSLSERCWVLSPHPSCNSENLCCFGRCLFLRRGWHGGGSVAHQASRSFWHQHHTTGKGKRAAKMLVSWTNEHVKKNRKQNKKKQQEILENLRFFCSPHFSAPTTFGVNFGVELRKCKDLFL